MLARNLKQARRLFWGIVIFGEEDNTLAYFLLTIFLYD